MFQTTIRLYTRSQNDSHAYSISIVYAIIFSRLLSMLFRVHCFDAFDSFRVRSLDTRVCDFYAGTRVDRRFIRRLRPHLRALCDHSRTFASTVPTSHGNGRTVRLIAVCTSRPVRQAVRQFVLLWPGALPWWRSNSADSMRNLASPSLTASPLCSIYLTTFSTS